MSSPTSAPATGVAALDPAERQLRGRVLTAILVISWIDLILLAVLLYGVAAGIDSLSPIFGPIHGIGVIAELGLVAWGANSRWWGWWYPIVTLVTTGPPGAILGHRKAKHEALGG